MRCRDAEAGARMMRGRSTPPRRPETRWAASSRCSRSGTRPASAATCRATCVCAPGSPARCLACRRSWASSSAWASPRPVCPAARSTTPLAHEPSEGYVRASNRAGGIEGGISTGETIVVRAAMKPISTLRGAAGQRGDGVAHGGQVALRALRRLRGPGGRHRPGGRRSPWRWRTPRWTASAARRWTTLPPRPRPTGGASGSAEPAVAAMRAPAAVALVGFMGAGKSAVGRELAAALGHSLRGHRRPRRRAGRLHRRHLRGARRSCVPRPGGGGRRRRDRRRSRAAVRAGAGRRRGAERRRAGGARAPAARRLARRAGRRAVGARPGRRPGGAAARRRRGRVRRAARGPRAAVREVATQVADVDRAVGARGRRRPRGRTVRLSRRRPGTKPKAAPR